jgi:serine/threonine-protein kinase HipA
MVEIEKLFRLIVFNYLFSNGDAHLKNFSILETANGDYILSPAYDLVNTRIHIDDSDFALDGGLFKDDFESEEMKRNGRVGLGDFYECAKRLGISETRRDKLIEVFLVRNRTVETLVQGSFLDDQAKRTFLEHYHTRRNQLNTR